MARRLAAHGAVVAVNYAASREGAEAVVAQIRESGGIASAYRADVLDDDEVAAMIAAIEVDHGRLDAVVNNAVAGDQQVAFDDADLAHFSRMYDYAVRAVVVTTQAALPAFARAGGGTHRQRRLGPLERSPGRLVAVLAAKGAMVGLSRSSPRSSAARGHREHGRAGLDGREPGGRGAPRPRSPRRCRCAAAPTPRTSAT